MGVARPCAIDLIRRYPAGATSALGAAAVTIGAGAVGLTRLDGEEEQMIKDRKHPSREGVRDWRKPVRVDGPATVTEPVCHLVVGFDRYPASHQALSFAMGLAVPLRAYLHVAHVVDLDDFPVEPDRDDWERRIVETVERERTEACTMLASSPGNWSYYSHEGNPAHLLATIADANDALMIIIGSSRGGLVSVLERAWGESVSSHLIHHGRCPVVLVPEHIGTASPAAGR